MSHAVDLKTLTKEELQTLKQTYEDQREVFCQEYLVYANKCIEHMEDPDKRDFWDSKIKELEGPTQRLKHQIMDCINAIEGIDNRMGNLMPGKTEISERL